MTEHDKVAGLFESLLKLRGMFGTPPSLLGAGAALILTARECVQREGDKPLDEVQVLAGINQPQWEASAQADAAFYWGERSGEAWEQVKSAYGRMLDAAANVAAQSPCSSKMMARIIDGEISFGSPAQQDLALNCLYRVICRNDAAQFNSQWRGEVMRLGGGPTRTVYCVGTDVELEDRPTSIRWVSQDYKMAVDILQSWWRAYVVQT